MSNLFLCPQKIITGSDALENSGSYLMEFGEKALIVTDSIMVEIGNVQKLTDVLIKNGIQFHLFAEINSEPTDVMVYRGLEVFRRANCDFIIAIGGGSPIDAMKAIGALVTNQGALTEYIGKELKNPPPNLVAIPTTSGTGSEATQFTIISDTVNKVKMLLKGSALIPSLAIIDAELTMSVPANVTAATGIDALTHAIEAYTSKKAQSLSDSFAISACRRIFANLRKVYCDGKDFSARQQMSLASLEAGIAFNNSSVTIVHGMSRPIGALFHIPHGASNAVLMGECLNFAAKGAPERFAELAKAVGFCKDGMSDCEAAEELVNQVVLLCADINIPSLQDFGVNEKEYFASIDKMVCDALESGSPGNTMRKVSASDIAQIYKNIWK